MNTENFNRLGPKEQARMIIAAGAKARGKAPPPMESVNDSNLAAMIVAAGRKARGQE